MGTKRNPGIYDCYANLEPDEPHFVLMGRDPNASSAVKRWIAERRADIALGIKPMSDLALVAEAETCAADMERYCRERAERMTGQKLLGLTDGTKA